MRALVLLAALVALPAHADLYRWVDPQSGSIKYSNHPPPWFGDPEKEARFPAVQVIRHEQPKPPPPAAAKAPAKPAAVAGSLSAMETQLANLLQFFQSMPTRNDFDRTSAAFQQQADMYRAVSAELDRQDPAGAARRRAAAQQTGLLDQLRQGLEAQFSTKPPGRPPLPPGK